MLNGISQKALCYTARSTIWQVSHQEEDKDCSVSMRKAPWGGFNTSMANRWVCAKGSSPMAQIKLRGFTFENLFPAPLEVAPKQHLGDTPKGEHMSY